MLFVLRKTAAVYIRTMPQGDGELYRKGLLRNATKSKRGIFIGRHARQNLFDLFMDDKVSAKDAEVICQLTQNLTDEARVEEIQSRAAGLLRDGKSWEYIGGMTQLLANKERVTMRQGLLDLGADFEADLDKMARCIELNMQALKNAIKLLKMGKRLSKDNRAEAERLGVIATTSEDSEGKLAALQGELTRWEYIGSYPDLIAGVQMWDGETKPDPVRRVLENYELRITNYELGREAAAPREGAAAPRGELPGELFGNSEQVGGAGAPHVRGTMDDVRFGNSAATPRDGGDVSMSARDGDFEGEVDFSSNMEEGEKRYRVVNDKVGLSERLNEVVEPVEINFTGDMAKEKAEYEQRLGRKLSDVAYYREAIVDALLELAEKYPDGMEIEGTGLRVMLPTSRGRAVKAQGRARNAKKRMAVTGLEDVIKKAVHLGSEEPEHKKKESKRKKGIVATVSSFEKFGYPVHLNGEEMLFWFNGTVSEDAPNVANFYEFGVTDVEKKEAGVTRDRAASTLTSQTPASGDTLGDVLSRVKNKNVVDVKKDSPEQESGGAGAPMYDVGSTMYDLRNSAASPRDGGDVSMSVRNLAAVHTIDQDDFINAADELGGMPLPSVAVTRLDKPYRWGDDRTSVTLVARPDMVDPRRGTDVYSRDAWTGRMPRIETEMDGEDLRTFFYDEEGEKVDATLENLTYYLYGRKRRGNEATEREMDLTWTARSYLARKMKDMEDVKGQRERLQGEDEVRVLSEDIGKWMNMLSERYDTWLGDNEWIGVFEALADLDEVTEESVRDAIMGWTDFETVDLFRLQESEAMEAGSDFIKETVRILRELRAEKTDYLEAVPQRAVRMNEWVYALFSDKVGNKEAVRRVCEENGIIPIEYKAGERNKALKDLIDDGEVSFSVTFSPAERSGLRALRELANGAQEARFRSDTLGQDVVFPLGSAGELKDASNPKSRVVDAFGFMHLITMRMAHGESLEEACYTACKAVMAAVNGRIVPERSNNVRKIITLEQYDCVVNMKWDSSPGAWVITGYKETGERSSAGDRRKAMHLAEGYAPDSFVHLKEVGAALDYGIARLAREYKQNNADPNRKAAKRYYGDFSGDVDFSGYVDHVDVNQRVWDIMRGRNGEAEGEKVAEEWGRLAQVVSLKIAAGGSGGDDKLRITNYELRIGNSAPTAREGEGMLSGAEMIGRMMALIAATRKVLPDRWGNARGVGQMLAWAKWYAQMAESGQVVRTDTLRGAVYEKALAAMRGADERRRNSYTEAEAEAWLKRHAGERLDGMLLNLAKRMRRQIEQYVKENMREDMLETVQALYPKMEPGTHIKRGKATTATYRYAEYVKKALMMRGDWLVNDPVHQEAVGRLERKLRRSDLTEEERAKYERALEELREEEVNNLSEEIERQQDILDDPNKSEEAKEAAREYLHALRTFGGWRYKDFSECQQAYARFEEVIIRGKRLWQEQEAQRRKKMGYIKKRVRQTQDRHKRSAWATDG